LKRHFHQHGFDSAGDRFGAFSGRRVADIAFGERQRRQKPQVEIIAEFQVGYNSEVKPWASNPFRAAEGVVQDKIPRVVDPEVALILSERDAEVVLLGLKVQVVVIALIVLCAERPGARQEQETEQERRRQGARTQGF
jgi:hypothetical protein